MYLPEDIVIKILSHLPVQSLLRFKSVCKSWCNAIDSIALAKSHLQNQLKNTKNHHEDNLILQIDIWPSEMSISKGTCKSYELDFPEFFNDRFGLLAVTGPVNGLICLWKNNLNSDSISVAVCNPCIGKIKILPATPVTRCMLPLQCKIGFGYDYIRQEYKVVQLTLSGEGQVYVEVYSPTTNTWRQVVTNVFDDEVLAFQTMVMNNSVYKVSGLWAHWQIQRLRNEKVEDVILSFDMHNEVFKMTLIDISKDNHPWMSMFARDDDSFVVFVPEYDDVFGVWEGCEGCWTLVGDVDLRSTGKDPWPETLWKRDVNVILISESEYDPHIFNLFLYDYCRKEIKRCEIPSITYDTTILEYRCSLISP